VPVCACGRDFGDGAYPTYGCDLEHLAGEVVRWLLANGHERVGVLGGLSAGTHSDPFVERAVDALARSAHAHGLALPPERIFTMPTPTTPAFRRVALDFIEEHADCTAWVALFQLFLHALAVWVRRGLWPDGNLPAVIDYNMHYAGYVPRVLARTRLMRANYALEDEGRAMGRYLVSRLSGGKPPHPEPVRATLADAWREETEDELLAAE
jgi:DNA-binding LacI/PurR family transcriptional regulator